MQQAKLSRQLLAILLIAALFSSACSSLITRVSERPQSPKVSPEARGLLLSLQNQNLSLKTFKGAGRITFQKDKETNLPAKVAWVGLVPGRVRIALYSISGQPAVSFASDGQWLYLFSHTNSRFYKKRAAGKLLERFFSIPIKSNDVVSILAGRVPVGEYDCAVVEKKGSEYGSVLILKRWGNVLKKIYFDKDKQGVRKIEVFDAGGALLYRVLFNRMQAVNGYQVPAALVFSNDENAGFQLDIDRYWADITVSPSVFVLTPPKLKD